MSDIKLFNRWSTEGIVVEDLGLQRYISLKPMIVPRSGSKISQLRFRNAQINIVERFINKLLVTGHKSKKHFISSGRNTGKGMRAYKMAEDIFKMVEERTKQNPIAVFVKALENASPREEVTAIEYGGARYAKALEMSPQRRVDFVLRMMIQGAYLKSFGKKLSAREALTDEIVSAYKMSNNSSAISKKLELERQADSSR